jgi:sensor histidine kinase YesM
MNTSLPNTAFRIIIVSLGALAIPLLLIKFAKVEGVIYSLPRVWIFFILYVLFFNLNSEGNLYFDRYLDQKLPWFYFPRKRVLVQSVFMLVWSVLTLGMLYLIWYFLKDGALQYPQFLFFIFIISVLFLTAFIGVSQAVNFIKQWKTTLLEVEKIEREKLKADYKALQNQVNPHFLFNSLNVLISEIKHDPDTAETFTRKLSMVYRYVLQSKNHELISLSKELDFIRSFIYLHQVRLGDALKVTIDIGNDSKQLYLPPLTLQVLVENAIKHNVINEENPLHINIATPETQILIVKNNLNPKQSFESTNTGLSNIKARYELLKEDGIKIEKSTTEFIVTVPLLDE